jgi:hypothetical protein
MMPTKLTQVAPLVSSVLSSCSFFLVLVVLFWLQWFSVLCMSHPLIVLYLQFPGADGGGGGGENDRGCLDFLVFSVSPVFLDS